MQSLWRTVCRFFKTNKQTKYITTTTKIELTYNAIVPLLGICMEKTINRKDTHILMFIAALFTKTKTWKQPRYTSTVESIKMWTIYTMHYYSAINNTICSNTDESGDYHYKGSKPDREGNISYDIIHTCNLIKNTNECIYKMNIESKIQKTILWLPNWNEEGVN